MARITSAERKDRKLARRGECALIGHLWKPKPKGATIRNISTGPKAVDYKTEWFCANCHQWADKTDNWRNTPNISGYLSQPYLTAKLKALAQPQFNFQQFTALPKPEGGTIIYDRANKRSGNT